jgi:hypothetical protein
MRMHRVQFSMAHPCAEGEQVTEIVPMKDGSDIPFEVLRHVVPEACRRCVAGRAR